MRYVSRCYKQRTRLVSSVRKSVKRGLEHVKLLEAVVRERLVKTQQAGRGLAGAVMICELCGAVITCSSESCI
jgi:hypothetical protein